MDNHPHQEDEPPGKVNLCRSTGSLFALIAHVSAYMGQGRFWNSLEFICSLRSINHTRCAFVLMDTEE
jgi:hypothetical protein